MAKLLFHLRDVPDEEADEVRRRLDEHDFEVYETAAGRWKLAVPAIWLTDETRFDEARAVIDAYQRELTERARRDHADARARGEAPTLGRLIRRYPLAILVSLIALGLVLTLSLLPFLTF